MANNIWSGDVTIWKILFVVYLHCGSVIVVVESAGTTTDIGTIIKGKRNGSKFLFFSISIFYHYVDSAYEISHFSRGFLAQMYEISHRHLQRFLRNDLPSLLIQLVEFLQPLWSQSAISSFAMIKLVSLELIYFLFLLSQDVAWSTSI